MLKLLTRSAALALTTCLPLLAQADVDGELLLREQCASCHNLERPDFEILGISERLQRKAPLLYFAGNKYRQEWLVGWLQAPETIHPAGYYPLTAVRSGADGDEPNPLALHEHVALNSDQAKAVAEQLMTLRPHDDLINADNYTPGSVNPRMGMMDFRKFKGCNACHQDAQDEGGFSGPILHNVWQRLQPSFISSFVQDPTAWDPNSAMPVPQMNEPAVHKLVNYLKSIGGEND